MSTDYYTTEEAMRVLKKTRPIFLKEVEEGTIPSVFETSKSKVRRYPKEAIDILAQINTKIQTQSLTFQRATNSDIWAAVENGRKIYGERDNVPYKKELEWRLINDEMSMSIREEGIFAGCSTFMPLDEQIILELIHDRLREKDIPDQEIKTWGEKDLSVYITNVAIVSTGNNEKDILRGSFLLINTLKWVITLYYLYDIKNFYGIGTNSEGQMTLKSAGFKEVARLEKGKRKGYVLQDIKKLSKFIGSANNEEGEQVYAETVPEVSIRQELSL